MKLKQKLKQSLKLNALRVGSFVTSAAPLAVVLGVNWGKYTTTPSSTVKLCSGAFIAFGLIAGKALGKVKLSNKVVFSGVLLGIAYLMQAILPDLILLLGMSFAGNFADYVLFEGTIKNYQEQIANEKTADVTAEKIGEVLENYIGRM